MASNRPETNTTYYEILSQRSISEALVKLKSLQLKSQADEISVIYNVSEVTSRIQLLFAEQLFVVPLEKDKCIMYSSHSERNVSALCLQNSLLSRDDVLSYFFELFLQHYRQKSK